jgi:hypothetical protein
LLPVLDRELDRLPDKYRVPVVLCELEGRSRKDVARTLGLPEGTLSWRLAQAKKLLARRLAPHGAVSLALVLWGNGASASVPSPLLHATEKAALRIVVGESLAGAVVSAQVIALTEGVLKAMLLHKLKTVWAVALVVAVGAGALGLTYGPAVAQPAPSISSAPSPSEKVRAAPQAGRVAPDELEELRLEVAALRKGLEVTRERVKALEGEVQTLKASRPARGTGTGTEANNSLGAKPGTTHRGSNNSLGAKPGTTKKGSNEAQAFDRRPSLIEGAHSADPLADAEAALKELRQNPSDKQAADALERAVKQLGELAKPADQPKPANQPKPADPQPPKRY